MSFLNGYMPERALPNLAVSYPLSESQLSSFSRRKIPPSLDMVNVPKVSTWSCHPFSNLKYLAHYGEGSFPFPADMCDKLARYNLELSSHTFSNLALASKVSTVIITAVAAYSTQDALSSVVVAATWGSVAEIVANQFEKIHSKRLDAADKKKVRLREEITSLYKKMAEELIDQYTGRSASHRRRGHNRSSVAVKIAESLLKDKLECIKADMLSQRLYDLHYDEEAARLKKRVYTCFKSEQAIKEELKTVETDRINFVDEILKPLKHAAEIVLYKHQGILEISQCFQNNEMFSYYLKNSEFSPNSIPSHRLEVPSSQPENFPLPRAANFYVNPPLGKADQMPEVRIDIKDSISADTPSTNSTKDGTKQAKESEEKRVALSQESQDALPASLPANQEKTSPIQILNLASQPLPIREPLGALPPTNKPLKTLRIAQTSKLTAQAPAVSFKKAIELTDVEEE